MGKDEAGKDDDMGGLTPEAYGLGGMA
jgi:hypothetical protein